MKLKKKFTAVLLPKTDPQYAKSQRKLIKLAASKENVKQSRVGVSSRQYYFCKYYSLI